MIITDASHTDHGLAPTVIDYILARFADRSAFFIETIEIPEGLPSASCGLYGPIVGDAPVPEADVSYHVRGTRDWSSRMVDRSPRPTRTLTVIAGPHNGDPCVLYTAFGGPLAPQEPGDPKCANPEASTSFWAQHALARLP